MEYVSLVPVCFVRSVLGFVICVLYLGTSDSYFEAIILFFLLKNILIMAFLKIYSNEIINVQAVEMQI